MISVNTPRPWSAVRTSVWILAVSTAAVMASERLYWYWSGIDAESVLILAGFYGVAVAVGLCALALTPGDSKRHIVLSGALFGMIVEGVITPVFYEDGPLPLMFLMFVGWHGLLAWAGFVFAIRRWALNGQMRAITIASTATGALWGLWALSSGVFDRVTAELAEEDGGSADVLTPGEFAVYAALVVAVLIVAHLVIDRVWPAPGWRPGRWTIATVAVTGPGLFCLMVLPFVIWAPAKFGLFLFGLWWMRRRLPDVSTESPTVIDDFAGRIRASSLVGVTPMAVSAAATYAAVWPARDTGAVEVLWQVLIYVQVVAGLAAIAWLLRRGPSKIPTRLARRHEEALPHGRRR